MILLQLKLSPSGVANKFVLFLVLRSCSLAGVIVCVLLFPVAVGVAALVIFSLVQVGYYFYVQRLVLCIFTLAQKAEEAGQPVGRPSSSGKSSRSKPAKDIGLVEEKF